MKNSIILFILFLSNNVWSQQGGEKFYSPDFNWTIILPEGLENMGDAEGEALYKKGLEHVEKAYGTELENVMPAKNIITLKQGIGNMFEVNMQVFSPSVENYENSLKDVWEIMLTTYKDMAPGAEITSENSIESISGLKFYKNTIIISLPNGLKLSSHMYSRLFGQKDFTLNMLYTEKAIGDSMMKSWKSSLFN